MWNYQQKLSICQNVSPLICKNPWHFLFLNDVAGTYTVDDSVANNLPYFPTSLAHKIRSLKKKRSTNVWIRLTFWGKSEKHSSLFGLFFEKPAKIRAQICPASLIFSFELCGRTFGLLARLTWMKSCYAAELSASWQCQACNGWRHGRETSIKSSRYLQLFMNVPAE